MKKALFLTIPMAAATTAFCIIAAKRKSVHKLSVNPKNTSPHVKDDSPTPEPYYAKSQIWCD